MKKWDGSKEINIHQVEIHDSTPHYHNKLTEIYLVLEGGGEIYLQDSLKKRSTEMLEFDSKEKLKEGDLVIIPPKIIHYAKGNLFVEVIGIPGFIPNDLVPYEK